jgi:hypothetical protein
MHECALKTREPSCVPRAAKPFFIPVVHNPSGTVGHVEIIIIMCWSIWIKRNSWLFNDEDPSVEKCKATFKREFALIIHRTKDSQLA